MSRFSGSTSSSSEDEDLARRLQLVEQSRAADAGSVPRRFTQQEIQDREVAREFAQMDFLRGAGGAMRGSRSRAFTTEDSWRRQHHARNRSFSPKPTTDSGSAGGGDPFDYSASVSPKRRSPRRVFSTAASPPSRRNGVESLHALSSSSRSPRRRTGAHTTSRSQSPTAPLGAGKPRHRHSRSMDIDHELLARAGLSYGDSAHRKTASASARHFLPIPSPAVAQVQGATSDEDLARRMQDLEDRGMGRLNSDRALQSMDDAGDEIVPPAESAPVRRVSTVNNADLARMIAESGTNLDEVSDDVLRELLGSTASEQLKLAATNPNDSSFANSSSINDLRAALTGVDPADIQRRAQQLDRSGLSCDSASIEPTEISLSPHPARKESAPESRPARIPSPVAPFRTLPQMNVSPSDSASHASASPTKQKKKRGGFLKKLTGRSSSRSDALAVPVLEDHRKPPPSSIAPPGGVPFPMGGSMSASTQRTASLSHIRQRSVSPPPGSNKVPMISGIPTGIPAAGIHGVKPSAGHSHSNTFSGSFRGTSVCAACGLTHGSFLKAFDRKYHPECFRCKSCDGKIDPNDQFKYTTDQQGRKHPHHRECYISFGVSCAVCKQNLPMTAEGKVPFIKHPFFDDEKMCVRHADELHRRCAGCQRFEPQDTPFIDIMDGDRSVCPACCRSVVVDNRDAKPLWNNVLAFFENYLKLPVWGPLWDLPILLVGSETLVEQMKEHKHIHGSSSHPMTAGLCLTEQNRHAERYSSSKPKIEVISILCLTGLPSDLTASVLAHEAAHAWIKMHPKYDMHNPLPPQVEEGVAQLIAMLFLSEGLGPAPKPTPEQAQDGPSDEKLRQYFKFSIERETSDIYGNGYRRAAMAYRDIGIEALLTHVLQCRDFPVT